MDNWLTLDTWGKQVCDRIKQVFFSMENPEVKLFKKNVYIKILQIW